VSDAAHAPLFPLGEICGQAQGNAAACILTMIAYLKERGGGRGLRGLPRTKFRAGLGMVARPTGRTPLLGTSV